MNFFERQDEARGKTKALVLYFFAAVVLTVIALNAAVYAVLYFGGVYFVSPHDWVYGRYCWYLTGATLLVILTGSSARLIALAGGGRSVAEMVHARQVAPDTRDPGERRLINIVEEMSIASGVPVPELYVMDGEPGINAFVAGYKPSEAVLVVTKGALGVLDRDELQGVVGHEYSHILNGDMRINVRLIGILAGILALGQIGYFVLRSARATTYSSRGRSRGGGGAIILIGLALLVVGYIGLFFGRLIKAAISRQREFLADASSVQFTRNPAGIAGALLKIKEASEGSLLMDSHAEDMSHMCFEQSVKVSFSELMATHPPIEERIRLIDPSLLDTGGGKKRPRPQAQGKPSGAMYPEAAAGFGAAGGAVVSAGLSASVGNPTPEHVDYAAELRSSIPVGLLDALHTPRGAMAAVYTLLVAEDPGNSKKALALLQEREGGDVTSLVMDYRRPVSELGPRVRLPLVELAVPALKRLGPKEAEKFVGAVREFIELDRKVSVFEYALIVLLRKYLGGDGRPDKVKHRSFGEVGREAGQLLSALAFTGGDQEGGRHAMAGLGLEPSAMPEFSAESMCGLDPVLRELSMLPGSLKQSLIDACVSCVEHDGRITVSEAELLRAVSAALDCPMPPVLA